MIFEELYRFDSEMRAEFKGAVCGTDEAGRGPLAGPVCCAAVVLDPTTRIDGLNDSKKLSEKKRGYLFDEIRHKALAWSVVFVDEEEIDRVNILNAAMLGMKKCVEAIGVPFSATLVDGNRAPELSGTTRTVIKGDAKSATIAAASILAKVSRDRKMLEYAELYPQYLFEQHKGYPTKLHYERIEQYGVCPIHRKTFLKKLQAKGIV